MRTGTILPLLVAIAFSIPTLRALADFGYIGFFSAATQNSAGIQVLLDLSISVVLICIWMVRDARRLGISALPFVALALVAGSFGPLAYLVRRDLHLRHRPLAGS